MSLLFFTFFSLYSPTKGYHIDTAQEQTAYNIPSPNSGELLSLSNSLPDEIVTDTLLIGVQPDATLSNIQKTLQIDGIHDLVVEKFWPEFNIALIRVPGQGSSPIMAAHGDAIQRLERYRQTLEQMPAIRYVNYNGWVSVPAWTVSSPPTHSEYARRLSTETVDYVEQDPANTEEVVVALIDSGYGTLDTDNTTYSLWENQAEIDGIAGVDDDENGFIDDYNGWDWIDNDNVMNDAHGHGTLIGDAMLDVIEQQGFNRHSVKIQPLRILHENGKGEIADLIDALVYAARKGVSIVNLSMVSYYNAPALEEAIEIVYEGGMLIISATSLCSQRVYWPAEYPETLSASAVYSPEVSGGFCRTSELVDIAVQVDASDVVSASSTSLAPPHVTAAAALILGQRPDSSNTDIKSLILSTASVSADPRVGAPVLDVDAIAAELEIIKPSLRAPQLDRQLYLPLITN